MLVVVVVVADQVRYVGKHLFTRVRLCVALAIAIAEKRNQPETIQFWAWEKIANSADSADRDENLYTPIAKSSYEMPPTNTAYLDALMEAQKNLKE